MSETVSQILAPASIIGNGMIARRFIKYWNQDDVVIFASGVSNSKEARPEPFVRERQLIETTLAQLAGRLFVYFSTTSVNDPIEQGAAYIKHKLTIEHLISTQAPNYLIVRASNVVGGPGNKHTLLNYFWEHIHQNKPFVVWQYATRNLIDLDDLYLAIEQAITCSSYRNQILTVANPHSVSPLQIVRTIEVYTGRQAIFKRLEKGIPFIVDTQIHQLLNVEPTYWQPDQYIARVLQKYY